MAKGIRIGLIGYEFMGKAHSNAYRQVSAFFDPPLTPRPKAVAGACYLLGGDVEDQVDRAAETALEHYLGLTRDPVYGLVPTPCIERNAAAAVAALNAASLAVLTRAEDKIKFDAVVAAMQEIGRDMDRKYKGTALGGLASLEGRGPVGESGASHGPSA